MATIQGIIYHCGYFTFDGTSGTPEGTVIDVGVFGKIGVDQACSGINGLQSSLVVTLFLGAYYGFGWINRLFLILSGMLYACLKPRAFPFFH